MHIDQKELFQTKETPATQENLPLVVSFNETLQNVEHVIDKHWHILSITKQLKKAFDKKPFIAYKRHKNLH